MTSLSLSPSHFVQSVQLAHWLPDLPDLTIQTLDKSFQNIVNIKFAAKLMSDHAHGGEEDRVQEQSDPAG